MKSASERPSLLHVIVTLVAMLYMNNFMMGMAMPLLFPTPSLIAIGFLLALALVWAYLIRDLIRQLSLFTFASRK